MAILSGIAFGKQGAEDAPLVQVGGDRALLEFRDTPGQAADVLLHRKRGLRRIHPIEGDDVAVRSPALRVRMEQADARAPSQDRGACGEGGATAEKFGADG